MHPGRLRWGGVRPALSGVVSERNGRHAVSRNTTRAGVWHAGYQGITATER